MRIGGVVEWARVVQHLGGYEVVRICRRDASKQRVMSRQPALADMVGQFGSCSIHLGVPPKPPSSGEMYSFMNSPRDSTLESGPNPVSEPSTS